MTVPDMPVIQRPYPACADAGAAVANVTELYRRGHGFAEYLVADADHVRVRW